MSGLIIPSQLRGPFTRPVELFPIELWQEIFKKVQDPQDLFSIINSNEDFHEMLEHERKYFLFPQVLDILGKQGSLRSRDNKGVVELHKISKPLLKCRQVCKTWDKMIQNYIQLHPKHFNVDITTDGPEFDEAACVFFQERQTQAFLRTFQASHCSPDRNPFVSRHVAIDDCAPSETSDSDTSDSEDDDNENEIFLRCVTRVLEKFGVHIYHLTIRFKTQVYSSTVYQLLQDWLSLTVNLRTFRLSFHARHNRVENPYAQKKNHRAWDMELSPMPTLEHLMFLKVRNVPAPIFKEFVGKNAQIEKLHVSVLDRWPARPDIYFRRLMFNNLQECAIDVRSQEDIYQLKSFVVGKTYPVKGLRINCITEDDGLDFDDIDSWIAWNTLFKAVKWSVGQTLVNLRMTLPNSFRQADKRDTLRQSPNLRLNLPYLKKLVVQLPFLSSVDFLLPLKESLEELGIIVDYKDEMSQFDKAKEKIKFNGLFGRMEESNMWEMLPLLKLLEVTVTNDWEGLRARPVRFLYEKFRRSGIVKQTREEAYSGRFEMNRVLDLPCMRY